MMNPPQGFAQQSRAKAQIEAKIKNLPITQPYDRGLVRLIHKAGYLRQSESR
jgi:hypothetical protein